MKITLEATETIDTVQGKIPARIWTGTTDAGVPRAGLDRGHPAANRR
jgi:hypothetical protein